MLVHYPYYVAAWVFLCGLYGIVRSRHLVHTVISLAVLQTSTYVLLLAIGFRKGGSAPIFADISPGVITVDPIVQALMLTDVVVEATVVALLLAMAVKAYEQGGTTRPDDLRFMRG
ncbi:MAG TPA: cation:proton antiporter subunit C [Acidobacteriaceae bacterium]|jgi:multicomponent Na+:H+ antiporter subunit C|nr:cation:proton antiporter subunit C [Acidobacteriaceae bacterium]